jgi:signal-transduction protein with cAMP-binding, CBS, and nucleotidyltransferase domain
MAGFMDRGETGTSFGSYTLVQGNPANFEVVALEDTLCLVMDAETFHDLAAAYPIIGNYFDIQRTSRMRGAVASLHVTSSGGAILKTKVTDIITRPAVSVEASESIRAAASVMSERRVSCLLVMDEGQARRHRHGPRPAQPRRRGRRRHQPAGEPGDVGGPRHRIGRRVGVPDPSWR